MMEQDLFLYNTATRQKELFRPAHGPVGLYCCGPTVYNYAHIGNLRTYIFEDVLKRTLLALGHEVRHVVNITDVGHLVSDEDTGEDKMEKGALREGKTVWEIAAYYTVKFKEDIQDLNILDADIWPKATGHLPEMIAQIQALENGGFTYQTSDGIYFDTSKFERYCDFARLEPDSLRAGSRVEMGEKKNATDFALWKFSPRDQKRQMEWESPWGTGFPGWHIECSAMSLKYLEQPLDIHCGGIDHIRVHHTNEIAQAEAATGRQFARFWLHGEFLVTSEAKMAKSGENFITLETLKNRKIDPLAYRVFCYTAHYRTPLAFSWEGILASAQTLKNLRKLVAAETGGERPYDAQSSARAMAALGPFYSALCDDLNMPKAMAALWDLLRNKSFTSAEKSCAAALADKVLGLEIFNNSAGDTETYSDQTGTIKLIVAQGSGIDPAAVFEKIQDRRRARAEKNFARADAIRGELAEWGLDIRDMPSGITECVAH